MRQSDLNCFLTYQAVQFTKKKKEKKSSSCLPKRGYILKSSDLRSIECQLCYRSLMKCSAKKVYLTLELLVGMGNDFYNHILFAGLAGVFQKAY